MQWGEVTNELCCMYSVYCIMLETTGTTLSTPWRRGGEHKHVIIIIIITNATFAPAI